MWLSLDSYLCVDFFFISWTVLMFLLTGGDFFQLVLTKSLLLASCILWMKVFKEPQDTYLFSYGYPFYSPSKKEKSLMLMFLLTGGDFFQLVLKKSFPPVSCILWTKVFKEPQDTYLFSYGYPFYSPSKKEKSLMLMLLLTGGDFFQLVLKKSFPPVSCILWTKVFKEPQDTYLFSYGYPFYSPSEKEKALISLPHSSKTGDRSHFHHVL